jgi:hypothetical protein
MTKRTKIDYLVNAKTRITGGRTTIDRKVEDHFQARSYGGSWMRVGAHSVFVGYTGVAVSRDYYPDALLIDDCPEMRDTRIGQIAKVRAAMVTYSNHPLYHVVMNACDVELTHWDAHGETPKHFGG